MEDIVKFYGGDSDSTDDDSMSRSVNTNSQALSTLVNVAPSVDIATMTTSLQKYHRIDAKEIRHNPTADMISSLMSNTTRFKTGGKQKKKKKKGGRGFDLDKFFWGEKKSRKNNNNNKTMVEHQCFFVKWIGRTDMLSIRRRE
ncbi:hypothetical protein RFI_08746 [Reticulomyxa filosa]|uniref:Uncharacterized protein n=1 Tax=Reticulomyxa filosa TaxID=46433 RepID=X6NQY4_RETFI|nr:hypothetical protein RFI_08746 [Reticulomyxa filosa]|eukprot:ETO28391.1 hypothetical protein RFI_08746 [Reticulomyxa filosa]